MCYIYKSDFQWKGIWEDSLRQKSTIWFGVSKTRGDIQRSQIYAQLDTCYALHWLGDACKSAPRAFLPTRPAFPHWRFMGLVMSRFMNFRDCTCPWKQLLINELKQLIIINNASRSPRTVSWRRRGAKAIKLVSGTAISSSCWDQILCGNSAHSLWCHCFISSRGQCQVLAGSGVLEGGQKNQPGMHNFFLFICIWLLCALEHMI